MERISALAAPTKVYLILGLIGILGAAAAKCPANATSCTGQKISGLIGSVVFIGLWALLIEYLYNDGLHKTSWFLALLPIIVTVFIFLFFFVIFAKLAPK
jgi:formate hydrogenlyase subunit 3/multisubunit Na+/H+ antiporter MnhD subunit